MFSVVAVFVKHLGFSKGRKFLDLTLNYIFHFGLHGHVFVEAATSVCPLAHGTRQRVVHVSWVYKTLYPARVFFVFYIFWRCPRPSTPSILWFMWICMHLSPYGPMGPVGSWAHGSHGPMGPMGPRVPWAHGIHDTPSAHGPIGVMIGPMGPMGLCAKSQGPGPGPGPFAFGARPQQKHVLGKTDMPHMWKRCHYVDSCPNKQTHDCVSESFGG